MKDAFFGALFGGLVALAGVWLSELLAENRRRRERKEAEADRWASMGFTALGHLGTLLSDAYPQRLGINANDETPNVLREIDARWNTLRPVLLEISHGHPVIEVREAAESASRAIYNALHSAKWFAMEVLRNPSNDGPALLHNAETHHTEAREAYQTLAEVLRSTVHGPH